MKRTLSYIPDIQVNHTVYYNSIFLTLIISLLGTQIDLRDDEETKQRLKERRLDIITTEQGQALCERIKAYKYMETSALTGQGVDQASTI